MCLLCCNHDSFLFFASTATHTHNHYTCLFHPCLARAPYSVPQSIYQPTLSNERVFGEFDYLAVGPSACTRTGTHHRVQGGNNSALITALTPASPQGYFFTVAACTNNAGCGTPATNVAPFQALAWVGSSPAPNKTNGGWTLVSVGKPAFMDSIITTATPTALQTAQMAGLATDGILTQIDTNAIAPSTHACAISRSVTLDGSGFIPYWRVDLGMTVNVAHITVYNRQASCL